MSDAAPSWAVVGRRLQLPSGTEMTGGCWHTPVSTRACGGCYARLYVALLEIKKKPARAADIVRAVFAQMAAEAPEKNGARP